MDIDRKERLENRMKFGKFLGFSACIAYIFFEINQILGLLLLPLAARMGARYFVHAAFDDLPYWLRRWRYRGWHGAYYEFDGRQLRIDDFDRDMTAMPLIAIRDLESLFEDQSRFRIKDPILPAAGLLKGIPSVTAERAVNWAKVISRTNNRQADRALKLAHFIEQSFIQPRETASRLNRLPTLQADRATPNAEHL